uniref:Uncharacterized protein n=1 Tax=Alexandrium andersonii TaxID=327968 RepID=A0A7S2IIF2_9DINO
MPPIVHLIKDGEDEKGFQILQEKIQSDETYGHMGGADTAEAIIVSGPGKSPPVFNLILAMAKKHNVATAMVFMPGHAQQSSTELSWEAPYGKNIGLSLAAKKALLVILHDDCVLGSIQRKEIRFLNSLGADFQLLTVKQFLQRYCAGSKGEDETRQRWMAGGNCIVYNKINGERHEGGYSSTDEEELAALFNVK